VYGLGHCTRIKHVMSYLGGLAQEWRAQIAHILAGRA
jgi:hypothetical protein